MNYPFVSILLATHNRRSWLEECLGSLFNQDYPKEKYEIIVINDGSNDGTEKVLRTYEKKAPCTFIWHTQRNQGKAAALNTGLNNTTKGEIICFTDDDCVADKNWIKNMLNAFKDERVGGVGGTILAYKPKNHVERYGGFFDQEGSVSLATGNAAYRSHIIKSVGGFDTQLIGLEDIDFGVRVRGKGYKLKYTSEAIIYHRNYCSLDRLIKRKRLEGRQLYNLSTKYEHYFNARKLIIKISLEIVKKVTLLDNISKIINNKNRRGIFLREIFEVVVLISTLLGLIEGMVRRKTYGYKGDKICSKFDFEFD
ncbi:glycosyltransferase [Candidatus Methanoperedens nitratireducens]|uniref:Putative glycosyltransferase n=1 Tax=Candidatus Methanoperedens nitratireducens TaxID=1392998 RepID=A0A284VIZ5_9EURY|nr:glycosyltransferase [Candidatus Methanoperedens nitroreducens]SNQ59246.1 putative glycosyltransferase [Candidatus Methanoperedens nitroreducens]